jgi:hypothetical protein
MLDVGPGASHEIAPSGKSATPLRLYLDAPPKHPPTENGTPTKRGPGGRGPSSNRPVKGGILEGLVFGEVFTWMNTSLEVKTQIGGGL